MCLRPIPTNRIRTTANVRKARFRKIRNRTKLDMELQTEAARRHMSVAAVVAERYHHADVVIAEQKAMQEAARRAHEAMLNRYRTRLY